MKARLLLLMAWGVVLADVPARAATTKIVPLSGQGPSTAVNWDFYCTKGRKSSTWTTIPVPSNWELQGFGNYDYGHVKKKHDEQGLYRRSFIASEKWKGQRVRLVFDGVMTDAAVKINGKSAGPIHQGGFYRFRYDITDLIQPGQNLLEVEVSKMSANVLLEDAERGADYWVFGGIYRPVYLEILPEEFIDRVAIKAEMNGQFQADVFPEHIEKADRIVGQLETKEGKTVSKPFSVKIKAGDEKVVLETTLAKAELWSAETPHLYVFRGTLMAGDRKIHEITQRFGFRSFEIRKGEGFFLNGKRILLQGFNRHCFRPETGRALDPEDSMEDLLLIKESNANAVRSSHYPPDQVFLDICDELGLYVVDELCNWQAPAMDTPIARKLIRELVERDVNHPAILFWANGNEGGFNFEVDDDYALYDPQKRQVLHPWAAFRGVDTAHYQVYDDHLKKLNGPDIFMPTEFLHGLYDGGHGSGLEDYWKAMRESKFGGGGFLWVFADEGLVRSDEQGRIDTDGNHAPDGIVGPHHEREGSFDTVRSLWSPVQIPLKKLPGEFDGTVPLENIYSFRSLAELHFEWALLNFSPPNLAGKTTILAEGKINGPAIAAAGKGSLHLPLPANWRKASALRLTAVDSDQKKLMTWAWPIPSRSDLLAETFKVPASSSPVKVSEDGWTFRSGEAEFQFSKETGMLIRASVKGRTLLASGPKLAAINAEDKSPADTATASVKILTGEGNPVIEGNHSGGLEYFKWTVLRGGLLRLDYKVALPAAKYKVAGIGFDLEDRAVKSKRWLGGGPFRVWKNRMLGPTFGIWENNWNNGAAGEVWELPEFKGFFKDVAWMRLDLGSASITVGLPNEKSLLGILRPPNGKNPEKAVFAYPEGDGLYIFETISGIGNKFHSPEAVGPQSKPSLIDTPFEDSVLLRFE